MYIGADDKKRQISQIESSFLGFIALWQGYW